MIGTIPACRYHYIFIFTLLLQFSHCIPLLIRLLIRSLISPFSILFRFSVPSITERGRFRYYRFCSANNNRNTEDHFIFVLVSEILRNFSLIFADKENEESRLEVVMFYKFNQNIRSLSVNFLCIEVILLLFNELILRFIRSIRTEFSHFLSNEM